MKDIEKDAWKAFKALVNNFLGNKRSLEEYVALVNQLLTSLKHLGARMSIKIHFLQSHLDYFPDNCGDYSKEQGQRFHQDIKTMESRYQCKWNGNMLADYCWCLKRDAPDDRHKRKSSRASVLRNYNYFLYYVAFFYFLFIKRIIVYIRVFLFIWYNSNNALLDRESLKKKKSEKMR